MSIEKYIHKIFKIDELKELKIKNLHLQETFDNKLKEMSPHCSDKISNLLIEIRKHTRIQQYKIIQSGLLDVNTNIRNELIQSINMYEQLVNKITNCNSSFNI
jgi:hypothetical protein